MPELKNSIIIGGGLAGMAAAYWAKRQDPSRAVTVYEKEAHVLGWTRRKGLEPIILGNVLPAQPEPSAAFPRGWPEVAGLLQKWPGSATRDWLGSHGIALEMDESGSFFVEGETSIADYLQQLLDSMGVEIRTNYAVESISPQPDGTFRIWSTNGDAQAGNSLLLATGGERNHGMALVREMGIETQASLPAYIRLRPASPKLGSFLGPITRAARLRCPRTGAASEGLLSLSGRGLEGPALSSLSCQFAQDWHQRNYRLALEVDWVPELAASTIRSELNARCLSGRRKSLAAEPLFNLEPRQWLAFLDLARIDPDTPWIRLKERKLQTLIQRLKGHSISFDGMGLPSGERAWAGGIGMEEMDGTAGSLRKIPGLHIAGEMLDMLGFPGGPHLNLIWASAHVAGSGMVVSG